MPHPLSSSAASANKQSVQRETPRKVTLLFLAMLTIMAGATISPSLPGIAAAYNDTPNVELLSRLILTLPALFVALAAPVIGVIADKLGRQNLLIASLVLYGLSGMSGFILDSLVALLVGRALLGVAVAGVMTLGTALVSDYFQGSERDRYMGLQQASTGFGGLIFLTAGGALAELHWRGPFAVYAVAFILLPAVIRYLKEDGHRTAATSGGAAPNPGRTEKTWLVLTALCLAGFMNSIAFYLIPSQLPFYLRDIGLAGPSSAGFAMGIMTLMSALASLGYGKLRSRLSPSSILAFGFVLMGCGLMVVSTANSLPTLMVGTAVLGVGMGSVVPNIMSTAMAATSPSSRGRTAGILTASIFIGQFVSPLVSQPWLQAFGYAATFRDAGLLLIALAVIAGAVAVRTGWASKARNIKPA